MRSGSYSIQLVSMFRDVSDSSLLFRDCSSTVCILCLKQMLRRHHLGHRTGNGGTRLMQFWAPTSPYKTGGHRWPVSELQCGRGFIITSDRVALHSLQSHSRISADARTFLAQARAHGEVPRGTIARTRVQSVASRRFERSTCLEAEI